MMAKKQLAVLVLLALSLMLAACGPAPAPTAVPTATRLPLSMVNLVPLNLHLADLPPFASTPERTDEASGSGPFFDTNSANIVNYDGVKYDLDGTFYSSIMFVFKDVDSARAAFPPDPAAPVTDYKLGDYFVGQVTGSGDTTYILTQWVYQEVVVFLTAGYPNLLSEDVAEKVTISSALAQEIQRRIEEAHP